MDLNRRLATAAAGRVAALVVTVPGWEVTRYAVERLLRERGWRAALSPADADVLVVCGPPGRRLSRAVDLVWDQLPGPRARVTAVVASAAGAALDQAVTELLDGDRQRGDAAGRPADPVMGTLPDEDPDAEEPDAEDPHGEDPHGEDPDGSDTDHGDHGDTDHGDHGDMDHGDMDMESDMAPGGIPLAEGGTGDRDGLDLDVLHVPLGPVLPCWPAGLLLHCTLSGDVVTDVRPEVLGPADGAAPGRSASGTPVDRLDRAAQLLTLAGWAAAATEAARLRDDLLADGAGPDVAARLDRLARRVGRSRLLRWSLRGTGAVDAGTCTALGIDPRAVGDVHDRLVGLLAGARDATDAPSVPLAALPSLLRGLELGALRLTVASLDLDPSPAVVP
ncbi:hypothetical protein [Geodermatophilus sp. DSM 44513]|uniref:hypothetical protein n=1 Tax=Geodermatophilus sp. DSM 44513 TaxID=1528104 RepID=UPI00127C9B6D|nr:hypothetical protein [Geodermatophilus sp. DSM 44513]WNV73751.1 hypothetical protein RTG05_12235 [Geodermatophilus sp. DSM 44513]